MKNNVLVIQLMLLLALLSLSASSYLPSPAMQMITLLRNMPTNLVANSGSSYRNSGYALLDYLAERIGADQASGPRVSLVAATEIETRFALKPGKLQVEFEVDASGIVTEVVLHQTVNVMPSPQQ